MDGILESIGKFITGNFASPVPQNQDMRTPQGSDLANYDSQSNQSFGNTPNPIPTPSQSAPHPQQPIIAKQPVFSNGTPAVSATPTQQPQQNPILHAILPGTQQAQASDSGSFQTPKMPTQFTGASPEFVDLLNNHILPVTRQYGIPDAVAAAQASHESGYGTSPLAKNNLNFFGLKGHTMPWAKFDTPEDAARYYAQTVRALVPNLDQIKNNPIKVLQALQSGKQHYEGDNANPMQYVYDVSNNPAWQAYNGGNNNEPKFMESMRK